MADDVSTKLTVEPCADGLYYFGGDLVCTYKLLSTTITENSVTFEYDPYFVTVTWENDSEGKRIKPKWERTYKEKK